MNVGVADIGAGPIRGRLLDRIARIDSAATLSAVVVAVVLACAIAPDAIAPFATTDMDHHALLQAPGGAHWLGTDHLGRDILSLLIHGARHSVEIALGAVLLSTLSGGLLGIISGFVGGPFDLVLMRLLDIWLSIPHLLLVIIIATALSPSLSHIVVAIGIVLTPRVARVLRSRVIALKHQPYIEACHAMGASPVRILLRHILPHVLSAALVMMTLGIANAVLLGAMLSFIGIGVIDDTPDWAFLLSQGRNYLTVAWWFGTFPGLAITALVVSVNLLGETLRHRLDPRAQLR